MEPEGSSLVRVHIVNFHELHLMYAANIKKQTSFQNKKFSGRIRVIKLNKQMSQKLAPNRFTADYRHFALISMGAEIL